MKNINNVASKILIIATMVVTIVLISWLTGCSPSAQPASRVALLAPFEGRYREVGYDAIYPAQLALNGINSMTLLAIDDGGSLETALERAQAITHDPLITAVVLLGPYASDPQVQIILRDIPAIIVGNWGVQPQSDHIFIMASPDLPQERLSIIEAAQVTAPYIGSDIFALRGFARLRDDLAGITILSSGSLPDDDFKESILSHNQFALPPNLLATTTYEAVQMIISAQGTRQSILAYLNIQFKDGYWENATIKTYTYNTDGELILSAQNVIK